MSMLAAKFAAKTKARSGIGLENEEMVPELEVSEIPDVIDNNEMELDATAAEEQNVQQVETDINQMTVVKDSLENIAFALESLGPSAKFDKTSAVIFNASLENALAVIGSKDDAKDDKAKEGDSTKSFIERTKETAKKAAEAIKAFILRIIDAVKGWLERFFSTAGSMLKTCKALMAKAKTLKGNDSAKPFEMNGNELQVLDKVIGPEDAVENAKYVEQVTNEILIGPDSLTGGNFFIELKNVVKKIGEKLPEDATFDTHGQKGEKKLTLDDMKDVMKLIQEHIAGLAKSAGATSEPPSGLRDQMNISQDSEVKVMAKPFIGNNMVFLSYPKKAGSLGDSGAFTTWIAGIKIGFYKDDKTKSVERVEVKPMSIDQIANTLSGCINALTAIIKFKEVWFKFERSIMEWSKFVSNDMLEALRKNNLQLTKGEQAMFKDMTEEQIQAHIGKHGAAVLRALTDVVISIIGFLSKRSQFEGQVCKSSLRSIHALVKYCGKSVEAHASTAED